MPVAREPKQRWGDAERRSRRLTKWLVSQGKCVAGGLGEDPVTRLKGWPSIGSLFLKAVYETCNRAWWSGEPGPFPINHVLHTGRRVSEAWWLLGCRKPSKV